MGKHRSKPSHKKEENKKLPSFTPIEGRPKKTSAAYPLPFPKSFNVPKGKFLRDKAPHKESFRAALNTAYEGFAVDGPNVLQGERDRVERALDVLEKAGFFRVDVTQPFGLGTKCAKTYVTRCLVGHPGTTYKYLGLRMFSHSWKTASSKTELTPVEKALNVVFELNKTLTERAKYHLSVLDRKRRERGAYPTSGLAEFSISLINRMECPEGLKDEPTTGEGKCSVSWHADSSLENYSTIAVYQLISGQQEGQWGVGLRVANDSEGPRASRRGSEITLNTETPPILVSLPSGSAYYMCDDFNHHHQHAVIAEGPRPGRRFSSTHRLLRKSHNVEDIRARCSAVCASFHKRGPKIWRPEQLLLTELESEWLRQFFIQGKTHHDMLWESWRDPIQDLLKFWSLLEERTKQTLDLLRMAAEGKCDMQDASSTTTHTLQRSERKLHAKKMKAKDVTDELVSRTTTGSTALKELYEPLALLIGERSKMRDLWNQRAKDGVFHEVSHAERPLAVPLEFNKESDERRPPHQGWSPLPGEPEELQQIAENLRCWGRAFESGNKNDLPCDNSKDCTSTSSAKALDWIGFGMHKFGLEMQEPWAAHLLNGKKSIETRAYPLPPSLIGRRVEILQSRQGQAGVSSIQDHVELASGKLKHIGWCIFDRVIEYRDQASFEADEKGHLVKADSAYGWKGGTTEVVYGWFVAECGKLDMEPQAVQGKAIRRLRSLFELQLVENKAKKKHSLLEGSEKDGKRKKKRY